MKVAKKKEIERGLTIPSSTRNPKLSPQGKSEALHRLKPVPPLAEVAQTLVCVSKFHHPQSRSTHVAHSPRRAVSTLVSTPPNTKVFPPSSRPRPRPINTVSRSFR